MTAPTSEIDRLARVVLWRWRTVLGWTVIGMSLVASALAMLPPLYSATALVLVAPQSNQGAATPTRPTVDAMRIESEVELLRSSGVLAAAAQALALAVSQDVV